MSHRIALLLSLCAVLVTAWVTFNIYEAVPHIEDEVAYVWQARLLADLKFSIPSPPDSGNFLVPFVVDYQGLRFGKYPPGWPALLSLGVRLGLRGWVNPLLAGIAVWLTYRLGRRLFNDLVGLLAAGLTLTSPFFLLNSGTLLLHPLGLVCSLGFVLGWLEAFSPQDVLHPQDALHPQDGPSRRLWTLLAALSLGGLCLSRPFTAIAVALPFGLHGLYLLVRGTRAVRLRLAGFCLLVLLLSSLLFAWQASVTGDPLLNPYTLWWDYDQVGFGPGHGHTEGGHTLEKARVNTKDSLEVGALDLFGWGQYSWLLLPFGLLAAWQSARRGEAFMVGGVIVSLVILYLAYWIGSSLFGPRYYYEGLFSLTIFSAAGAAWLAGWLAPHQKPSPRGEGKWRPLLVTALLTALIVFSTTLYIPLRLQSMYRLFDIGRADQETFLRPEAQQLTPALVVVQAKRWMYYAALLELSDPYLTTPFIFAWSTDPQEAREIGALYPDRRLLIYDPEEPFVLKTLPAP